MNRYANVFSEARYPIVIGLEYCDSYTEYFIEEEMYKEIHHNA